MHSDFPRNLRLLCSFRSSISLVALELSIHRSQLNRYLSGGALPRAPLMRRIGDYFGVELHELMLPHDAFVELTRTRGTAADSTMRMIRRHLDQLIRISDPRIRKMEGTFFEYYFSMSTPGMVLRSLLGFETQGNLFTYRRLERIAPTRTTSKRVFRYVGAAVMTGDRVFMNDYETGAGIELTQTILCPDYSHRWNQLHGIKLGVAANRGHDPCAVRVLLERTPPHATPRELLKTCGLFSPDSADLPDALIPAIENRTSNGHVFKAGTLP
jgi:hypothetical protein